MSVRAWFTISALVLVGLVVAFALRFFAPVPAPEIVARVGSIRLAGQKSAECWPQRDGKPKCDTSTTAWKDATRLRGTGTIHVAVAYPAKPAGGSLTISSRGGKTITTSKWVERLEYKLAAGDYVFRAKAEYPAGARVDYFFPITVTDPGS